jgi:hypothetical protein
LTIADISETDQDSFATTPALKVLALRAIGQSKNMKILNSRKFLNILENSLNSLKFSKILEILKLLEIDQDSLPKRQILNSSFATTRSEVLA